MSEWTEQQLLTESRVSHKLQSNAERRDFWRKHNKRLIRFARDNITKPRKWIVKETKKRFKAERKELDKHAKDYSLLTDGLGLLIEMIMFAHWKRACSNPHLCALDILNGNMEKPRSHLAAKQSGLNIEDVRILAGKARGMSDRKAGDYAKTNRMKANRTWTKALKAIESNQCWCQRQWCWMNGFVPFSLHDADEMDPKSLKDLIRLMRKGSVGSSGSDPLMLDKSGGSLSQRSLEMYDEDGQVVAGGGSLLVDLRGMPILEHRLIFNNQRGWIPSMHDIHHVDGNPMNNDVDNLLMLPRFLHRIVCGNARKGRKD